MIYWIHKLLHTMTYEHGLIEWEDTGHQQEYTEVTCSCGKKF